MVVYTAIITISACKCFRRYERRALTPAKLPTAPLRADPKGETTDDSEKLKINRHRRSARTRRSMLSHVSTLCLSGIMGVGSGKSGQGDFDHLERERR